MFGKLFVFASIALISLSVSADFQGKGGGGTAPPPNPEIAYVDGGIKVMNEDGTNQKLVVQLNSGESARGPAWSPDGTELVYWANHGGVRGIYRQRLDGTGRTLVAACSSTWYFSFSDWSRSAAVDGNHKIAYEDSPGATGDLDIYLVNPDGTGKVNLTNTPDLWEGYPAWLGDGRLAFDRRDVGRELVVCELGLIGGEIAIVSETIVDASGDHNHLAGANSTPALAFSRIAGSYSRIHVMDGLGAPRLLTAASNGDERRASFAPNDSKLAFWRGGSRGGIFTINADGTGEKKISSKGIEPRWKR